MMFWMMVFGNDAGTAEDSNLIITNEPSNVFTFFQMLLLLLLFFYSISKKLIPHKMNPIQVVLLYIKVPPKLSVRNLYFRT